MELRACSAGTKSERALLEEIRSAGQTAGSRKALSHAFCAAGHRHRLSHLRAKAFGRQLFRRQPSAASGYLDASRNLELVTPEGHDADGNPVQ
jgi:hypothetical protein